MKIYLSILTTMFSLSLQAQSFKGHHIGESVADFLKSEPAIDAKVKDCQANPPRALTPDEIGNRYGRKVYNRYMKEQAQLSSQGKHEVLFDKDPDAYGDKCGALIDMLENRRAHIKGNGYDTLNPYSIKMDDEFLKGERASIPPMPEVDLSNREFYFDKGELISLILSIAADYESVRKDVTSRVGVEPEEMSVPYHNAFGAHWEDITAVWDTTTLHIELSQEGNPAKPSLPHVLVQTQELNQRNLKRRQAEPKPLDP